MSLFFSLAVFVTIFRIDNKEKQNFNQYDEDL